MEKLSSSRKPTIPEAGSKVLGSPGVVKLQKMAERSKGKKPAAEKIYQKCLELLAEADQASKNQKAIMDEERSKSSQNLEQLRDSVIQMTSQIDQLKAQENKSLDGKSEVEKQLLQMKQALDAARTTNQHHVAWDNVFPVLQRAQRSLFTTASELGKMLELLQAKRNGMYLPGSTL